jgi:hypothetical protein
MPRDWSQRARSSPSKLTASAMKAPPGATITPVPVARSGGGRKTVSVGVTTFCTTVPTGVFS